MEYKQIMNLAILAGEIMLCSGAETYRAEGTMNYILRTAGTETVEASVTMTGIVATIDNPDMVPLTVIKRVQERGTNLNHIMQVNEISRKYCGGEISVDEAYGEMKHVVGKQYRTWVYNVAIVLASAGFAPLFGGGAQEILGAGFVGVILSLLVMMGERLQIQGFILDILSSMGVAVSAMWLRQLIPGLDMDIVIISAIMPMVPGVAITNAVRDTLQGDYVSGAARILEAFLKAAAIAIGVGVGMALMSVLFMGGVFK